MADLLRERPMGILALAARLSVSVQVVLTDLDSPRGVRDRADLTAQSPRYSPSPIGSGPVEMRASSGPRQRKYSGFSFRNMSTRWGKSSKL